MFYVSFISGNLLVLHTVRQNTSKIQMLYWADSRLAKFSLLWMKINIEELYNIFPLYLKETEIRLWAVGTSSWIGAYSHYAKKVFLSQSGIMLKNAH